MVGIGAGWGWREALSQALLAVDEPFRAVAKTILVHLTLGPAFGKQKWLVLSESLGAGRTTDFR